MVITRRVIRKCLSTLHFCLFFRASIAASVDGRRCDHSTSTTTCSSPSSPPKNKMSSHTTFEDASSDKKWNNPINWSTGALPGATADRKETAYVISGQTAYLDSDLPPAVKYDYNVTVGNGPPGGTVIASRDNPHLKNVRVATANGSVGSWEQNGGTSSAVNLAVGGPTGGDGGGSGTVKLLGPGGGMNLTDGITVDDSGSLMVHGENGAEVRAGGDMAMKGAALLHLYVGGTGATIVTLGGDLHVESAESRLIVDCGFYSGGSASIELVKYRSIVGSFSPDRVELVGLGAYGGSLTASDDGLNVQLTLSPPTTNQFATSSGYWGTATNWSQGSVPNGTSSANVSHNRTAIVHNGTQDIAETVEVGNDDTPNTLLQIEADFLTDRLLIASAGIGNVVQLNGSVTINRKFEIAASTMPPASAEGNGSSSTNNDGGYVISGGSLHFPYATLTVGTAGNATFEVEGCLSDEISGHSLKLGSSGSLRFVLDRAGVTPMKLSGVFEFDAGGVVTVDGTNYSGSSGYFPLIRGGTLLGGSLDPSTINFVGFDDRDPEIVTDDGGLWVRLNEAQLSRKYGGDLTGLFPKSKVSVVTANSTLSISSTHCPSESLWGAVFSQAHVMDVLMSHKNNGGDEGELLSWDVRIGRGGQIYSFCGGSIGEVVPPNNYAGSPWIDSVWQGVGAPSNTNYPDSDVHQSGIYLQDKVRTDPYYSPMVAAKINSDCVCAVNWASIAKSKVYTDDNPDNDWKSTYLFYNRYKDMGDGVIEVTLGLYNYGPIALNHMNLPWGGVRRTSMDFAFMSKTDGSWYGTDGYENLFVNNRETGGWIAYSDSTSGDEPALGVVFGYGDTPFEPGSENRPAYVRSNYYSNGNVPMPDATAWRNGHLFSNTRKFTFDQGRGVWCRYYFVLGSSVSDVQKRVADRDLVATASFNAFDYTEADTPLLGYSVHAEKNSNQILENSSSLDFYLYGYPVDGSLPLYEVTEKFRAPYLSSSRYANGSIKQYDGTIAGVRLLGFALRTSDANTTTNNYESLSDQLTSYADYSKAAGEDLSVRLPGMYVIADPKKVDLLLAEGDPKANGSIALNYSAASPSANIGITVTISAESHPGSFDLLSPATLMLSPPCPGSTVVDFNFEKTAANISSGETSTCLLTVAWSEQGSETEDETLVPISATISFP